MMQEMMVDPVIAADGHTYERTALEAWLQQNCVSPVDKQPFKHKHIFTNQAVKRAIATRLEQG